MKRILFLVLCCGFLQAEIIKPVPTPTPLTVAQQQQQVVAQVSGSSNRLYQLMLQTLNKNWALIWQNPNLTCAQTFAAFGTSAAGLFAMCQATQTYLNSIVPNSVNLIPPSTYQINSDGSVTCPAPSPTPTPSPSPTSMWKAKESKNLTWIERTE